MSNQAIAPQNGGLGALSALLEKYKHQIEMALPRHLSPERMIRVALTAVSQTPKLAECAPITIAASIVQASILGLEPSSVLGEAYLVPFWNGKTKRMECQLIPGYMGLLKLVRNTGELSVFDAQIVYSNDDFEFHKGSDIYWRHKWNRTGERGEKQGVWAGYVLKDGTKNFEYWTIEQIHRHRDQYSKGAYKMERGSYVLDANNNRILTGAWADSPDWLEKKTLIRQITKLMPKSVELSTALRLDELGEVGLPQNIDVLPAEIAEDPINTTELLEEPQRKSTGKGKAAASTAPASGPAPDVPLESPTPEPAKTAEAPADADPKKIKPRPLTLSNIKELKAEIGEKTWWAVMGESSFENVEDIPTEAIAKVVLGVMRGHVK